MVAVEMVFVEVVVLSEIVWVLLLWLTPFPWVLEPATGQKQRPCFLALNGALKEGTGW